MKYNIPENEKSKMRLIAKMPKGIRGAASIIIENEVSWERAKNGITELLTKEIANLKGIRTLVNNTGPVGKQRSKQQPVHPYRRMGDFDRT